MIKILALLSGVLAMISLCGGTFLCFTGGFTEKTKHVGWRVVAAVGMSCLAVLLAF